MSVIVKGMNVPDTCGDCCLYSHIDNVCQYDNTDMNYDDNRPPWCPLVELPEKHGRLIDGDGLAVTLETAMMAMKTMAQALGVENDPEIKMEKKAYYDIWNGVMDMPTVIEAEGSEYKCE